MLRSLPSQGLALIKYSTVVCKILSSVDALCRDVFTLSVVVHEMLFDVDEFSATCRGRSFCAWIAAASSTEMLFGLVEAK